MHLNSARSQQRCFCCCIALPVARHHGEGVTRSGAMGGTSGMGSTSGEQLSAQTTKDNAPPAPSRLSIWDLIVGPEATPWLRLLVQNHLSSSDRHALAGTCTAARDMMLATAEHLSIQLDVRDQASTTSLQAARAAMAVRGQLPTKLQLRASLSDQLSHTLATLEASTRWLSELHLRCEETLPTAALANIGRCRPRLRVLHIHAPQHEMPGPEAFPQLRELCIKLSASIWSMWPEALLCTTAAYLQQQLTSLALPSSTSTTSDQLLPLLLNPSRPAATQLHTLHLNVGLSDTLLGLLLQCAPALEDLTVSCLWDLRTRVHAHSQTRWRRLQLSGKSNGVGCVSLSSLSRLPLPPSPMELHVAVGCTFVNFEFNIVSSEEAEAVAARVRFTSSGAVDMDIQVHTGCDPETRCGGLHQPSCMRWGLSVLRIWSWGNNNPPRIDFTGWDMSGEVMRELAGLPCWETLTLACISWMPEPRFHTPLLGLVPGSYRLISIAVDELSDEQVEDICVGAPRDRTPEARLTIELTQGDWVLLEAMQRVIQRGGFPNVVVVAKDHLL